MNKMFAAAFEAVEEMTMSSDESWANDRVTRVTAYWRMVATFAEDQEANTLLEEDEEQYLVTVRSFRTMLTAVANDTFAFNDRWREGTGQIGSIFCGIVLSTSSHRVSVNS